jgi:hypothetical protein
MSQAPKIKKRKYKRVDQEESDDSADSIIEDQDDNSIPQSKTSRNQQTEDRHREKTKAKERSRRMGGIPSQNRKSGPLDIAKGTQRVNVDGSARLGRRSDLRDLVQQFLQTVVRASWGQSAVLEFVLADNGSECLLGFVCGGDFAVEGS